MALEYENLFVLNSLGMYIAKLGSFNLNVTPLSR